MYSYTTASEMLYRKVQQEALNLRYWLYTVSQKTATFLFFKNNSVKREPISIILGIRSLEVVNLSTSPEICHRTTL